MKQKVPLFHAATFLIFMEVFLKHSDCRCMTFSFSDAGVASKYPLVILTLVALSSRAVLGYILTLCIIQEKVLSCGPFSCFKLPDDGKPARASPERRSALGLCLCASDIFLSLGQAHSPLWYFLFWERVTCDLSKRLSNCISLLSPQFSATCPTEHRDQGPDESFSPVTLVIF